MSHFRSCFHSFNKLLISFILCIGCTYAFFAPLGSAKHVKKVCIIIDDLGNRMKGTEEILSLPFKVNVAIMPFMATTKEDALLAHERGINILVHMPMEPNHGRKDWLGPGAITSDLSEKEIRKRVEAAIDNVPFAVGMNNHMGSKITTNRRIMSIILDVCKERGLFFIDSKTDYKSVVSELAAEKELPCIENEVFLDDKHTASHITKQLKLIEKKLESQDTCVTIGHVGNAGLQTAKVIKAKVPEWSGKIEPISIREMVSLKKETLPHPFDLTQ
ncbi:divergent polysaccharide deacetylase family protein [Paenibacillus sp. 2TAF8]|uniref:divergent polysaccharide deacetylase family protein n=1 Tax=Paenibacillus sp. 2TAF8 TaxID=3233020 RepID=UPI003F9BA8B2